MYILGQFYRIEFKIPRQSYPLYLPKTPLNQHSGFSLHVPFVPIKSHETRIIVIPQAHFLDAVRNRLILNQKALKRFVNKKPIYIYFIYQTMSGTVKDFAIETDYQDALGKDLNIEALAQTLTEQGSERDTKENK